MTLQGVTGALVESCTLGLEFNQMQDMYYRTTLPSVLHHLTIENPHYLMRRLNYNLHLINFRPK